MTYARNAATMTGSGASLGDVLIWAEANGESYDAILELKKIPARMGMIDDDIGLIPADLPHFDKVVAGMPYGAVSRSRDLEGARRRGNSRVRALLERFFAAHSPQTQPTQPLAWSLLIEAVKALEGFAEHGAVLATGRHHSLYAFRARCSVEPWALSQAEVDRIHNEASSEKRRTIRKGIRLLNTLIGAQNEWPGLAGLLPVVPLEMPQSPDRAARITWASLPEGFRADAEAVFAATLRRPEDLANRVRAAMKEGRSSQEIDSMVKGETKERGRRPKNSSTAASGYRAAVTWLVRAFVDRGGCLTGVTELRDLFSRDLIDGACADQIIRSQASLTLKDPKRSQTLGNRLTNLRTLAKHGLRDDEIVAHVDIMRVAHAEFVHKPKELTEEVDHTCRLLRDTPHLAARFVQSPANLARIASELIAEARRLGDAATNDAERKRHRADEEAALRLFAAAVVLAQGPLQAHWLPVSTFIRASGGRVPSQRHDADEIDQSLAGQVALFVGGG